MLKIFPTFAIENLIAGMMTITFTKKEMELIKKKLYDSIFYEHGNQLQDVFMNFLHFELTEETNMITNNLKSIKDLLERLAFQEVVPPEYEENHEKYEKYNNKLNTIQNFWNNYNNTLNDTEELSKEVKHWGINRLFEYNP